MKDQFQEAAERLLGASTQSEQPPVDEPELESPEEETLEASVEVEDVVESEVEEDTTEESEDEVGDDSADEPESEEETDTEEYYTVKVDGEEFEVNLEELQKGYQLEKSYTKKAQVLSDDKKQLAELQQTLTQQRDDYVARIEGLGSQQRSGIEQATAALEAIDPDTDPMGYVRQQAQVHQMEKAFQASAAEYQRVQQEANAQWQLQKAELLKQCSAELSELIPEWNDPATQTDIRQKVSEFAINSGYAPEELENITASRDIVLLNKARLYDELVANKASVEDKRKPKIRPKAKSPAPAKRSTVKARKVKEQRAKHKSSGTLESARAAILSKMNPQS